MKYYNLFFIKRDKSENKLAKVLVSLRNFINVNNSSSKKHYMADYKLTYSPKWTKTCCGYNSCTLTKH